MCLGDLLGGQGMLALGQSDIDADLLELGVGLLHGQLALGVRANDVIGFHVVFSFQMSTFLTSCSRSNSRKRSSDLLYCAIPSSISPLGLPRLMAIATA